MDQELERRFKVAVECIQKTDVSAVVLSSDAKLKYYSLYKQSTVGRCNTPRPSSYDFTGQAKWNAWNALGAMSQEEAKRQYVQHFTTCAKQSSSPLMTDALRSIENSSASSSAASSSPTTKLVVYADLASQPARAVAWFCKLTSIPHHLHVIALRKGEHMEEWYTKINPRRKVPAIDDGGFVVDESHTILRYLSQAYKVTDNWYPAELKKRVRVDQYLDWHHTNTRFAAAGLFWQRVVGPRLGKNFTDDEKKAAEDRLRDMLATLNNLYLGKTRYVAGDQMSIGDILAACELSQLRLLPTNVIDEKHTNIARWQKEMQALPYFDEVHEVINKMKSRM